MVIRLIETTEEVKSTIPVSDGLIIYCSDSTFAYIDKDNFRTQINFIIKVPNLPETGLVNKVYFLESDSKLYRYDYEWYNVNSLEEFFDVVVQNEEVIGCYLTQNGKTITPITSSELVIRPSGENVEASLTKAENEIANNLNPYYRTISINTDGQTTFSIPLPYSNYLLDGNTFTLFVNRTLQNLYTDYTIDFENKTVTLSEGINRASIVEFLFEYNANKTNIVQEIIISEDKVRDYNLTNYSFIPGSNSVSLYINGIKQPKDSFIETSNTSIHLNGDIPKDSIMMIEIGISEISSDSFYDYFFQDRTEISDGNIITVRYPDDNFGRNKKIIKELDEEGRIITETAYINNIAVAVRNITYNDALGSVRYTHSIL